MAANDIHYEKQMLLAVRWRVDVPDSPPQDTDVLRGVRIESHGSTWYWVYTRRAGWQITAIDQ